MPHICVWGTELALLQVVACRLFVAKSLPMWIYCQFYPYEHQWNLNCNTIFFIHENAFQNVCEMVAILSRPHFYQTRSAWSMDQGSNENHSPVNNFVPTVTKFCVLWEGQALPQDTKFGNCRDKIVDSRAFISWSLIHGSSWSGLIKLGPERDELKCDVSEMTSVGVQVCELKKFCEIMCWCAVCVLRKYVLWNVFTLLYVWIRKACLVKW